MNETPSLYSDTLKSLFVEAGALLKGHFLLSSGLHSAQYLQCALLLSDTARAAVLGRELAKLQAQKPDLVLSPAMGGLIIGHEVARALKVRAYFAERENGAMTLRRGFALKPGEKVVVVEDVVTTAKSSGEVIALVRSRGAEVVGLLSIIDRSSGPLELPVPYSSLMKLRIETWAPEACVLCREGLPLVKPGSRELPAAQGA